MLYTRTEAIKNESLNDEAEEDKGNNDILDFIMKNDSNNIIIGFNRIVSNDSRICFDSSQSPFIKSKAFKGKISCRLYFKKPFLLLAKYV